MNNKLKIKYLVNIDQKQRTSTVMYINMKVKEILQIKIGFGN